MLKTLQTLLDEATYDKLYQNIDVLGVTGYDDSSLTWDRLTAFGIDFNGKTVCDFGCFHAIFQSKQSKQARLKS